MKTWSLEDVAAHWDNCSDYDEINARIDSYYRRFEDSDPLFSIPENARVLDIDCRTARGTVFFQHKYPSASFTCVAMAPSFVERARAYLRDSGVDAHVSLFKHLPLPFEDGAFEVILTYETLEHVPWPALLVADLGRILKPGGTLVLTTPNVLWEPVHWLSTTLHIDHGEGPHRMVPRKEILEAFEAARLRVVTEKTFVFVPAGPKWLLGMGQLFERLTPEIVHRVLFLRRTFVCEKRV